MSGPALAPDAADARQGSRAGGGVRRVALLGNPNTGKTTLFNHLTGLRHKTSNFPGTTQEARVGHVRAHAHAHERVDAGGGHSPAHAGVEVIDLPGVYSLGLEQSEARVCREALAGAAGGRGGAGTRPDAALVVVDATNLAKNLPLVGETLRTGLPVLVAVNMIDCARREGIEIDAPALGRELGCEVAVVCARSGEGLEGLREALERVAAREGAVVGRTPVPADDDALGRWAEGVASRVARRTRGAALHTRTDRVDRALTHPALGLAGFLLVMTGLFWVVFSLAQFPMGWIESGFAALAGLVRGALPEGFVRDLLSDGVIAGVGATLVFLPQIALLFFLISLLEDSGYLARAAFVADRFLRPFGLSGHSFVPLLSSHACALPGIMACRGVPDARERLATILVAPFMSCTARMPVYVLLATVLFPGRPALQALAFTGCYALGAGAGLLSAIVARRTVARGAPRPMALELPAYRAPSVRSAAIGAYDRALVFLKAAGTNILAICVILWWLGAFPRAAAPAQQLGPEVAETRAAPAAIVAAEAHEEAAVLRASALRAGSQEAHDALLKQADEVEARAAAQRSYIGKLGAFIEPAVRPLGWDRQLAIGVLASFAAREVFVSTMAVVTTGEEGDDAQRVTERLADAKRDDGVTPIFTRAASWSLLVYYVLAMQCLPTLAVTAREAGGVKWALLQLGWMSALAYGAAFVAFRIATALGA